MRKTFNRDHILSLCEPGDYGIFAPPMKAQVALDELCHYFLGDDWYSSSGCTNTEQINTEIVAEIEKQYYGCRLPKRKELQTLKEVPVGSIFKLAGKYYLRTSDEYLTDKLASCSGNALCLTDGHRCTLMAGVPVVRLTDSQVDTLKNEWKGTIPFKDLNIGARFRWHNLIGVKTHDIAVDYIKNPKSTQSNFINLSDFDRCIISPHVAVELLMQNKEELTRFSKLEPGTVFEWGDTVGLKLDVQENVTFTQVTSIFLDMKTKHISVVNSDIKVLPIIGGFYHEGFSCKAGVKRRK